MKGFKNESCPVASHVHRIKLSLSLCKLLDAYDQIQTEIDAFAQANNKTLLLKI